ncbi:MAG: hypothetical protein JXQ91_02205 [Vannielia sp.]|uniref:hypothetical protein n=1 Tax=Vannielia sp. TaxID=2813045 RepID=UPI003B8E71AC
MRLRPALPLPLLLALLAAAPPAAAAPCTASFTVRTGAPHGTLPPDTPLTGTLSYTPGEGTPMGGETVSYPATGTLIVTAPDGTEAHGTLRAIHVTRTPHFVDYISFDTKSVAGTLGGVTAYKDPMLLTLYAKGGALTTFTLPATTAQWNTLNTRRTFQLHGPQTFLSLPGRVTGFEGNCAG